MSFLNKKTSSLIVRFFALLLVSVVLIMSSSGCGRKKTSGSDAGKDTTATPQSVSVSFSEAYSKGDYKTADSYLLYIYADVMSAATGEYASAEEYYKQVYACSSTEDYYKIISDWSDNFLSDTYGDGYSVTATAGSCKKLTDAELKNIKEYYEKFYEACELNSEDYFNISDIEEANVVTCKCTISGDLENSSTDDVYIVFKIGGKYKLIQCQGVTEDTVQTLIDSIPARTEQLAGLIGQGALKERSSFNEYFYLLGLQN